MRCSSAEWIARNRCALRWCHRGVGRSTEETVGFHEWTAQFCVWQMTGKDSSEVCAIACQNWAVYSVFPSGMTSPSKIARFNWECIVCFRADQQLPQTYAAPYNETSLLSKSTLSYSAHPNVCHPILTSKLCRPSASSRTLLVPSVLYLTAFFSFWSNLTLAAQWNTTETFFSIRDLSSRVIPKFSNVTSPLTATNCDANPGRSLRSLSKIWKHANFV